jgi:CheY-specific phosphatase CheX
MSSENLDGQIEEIVKSVFEITFGFPLERYPKLQSDNSECTKVVSLVHILGGWTGIVILDFGIELLRQISINCLDSVPDKSESSLFPLAGEITNMIGGNLKPLLGNLCALSTPYTFSSKSVNYPLSGSICVYRQHYSVFSDFVTIRLCAGIGASSPIN